VADFHDSKLGIWQQETDMKIYWIILFIFIHEVIISLIIVILLQSDFNHIFF
jgi:hypothetical protein